MRGLVNYYVDEDEENYAVVRGEEDVYKFQLSQTGVELHDPVKEDIPLEFKENGLTFTTHSSQVNLQTGFDEETRRSYERELEDLLKTKLGNVSEVEFFDHNIRYGEKQVTGLTVPRLDPSGRSVVATLLLITFTETSLPRPPWPGLRRCLARRGGRSGARVMSGSSTSGDQSTPWRSLLWPS